MHIYFKYPKKDEKYIFCGDKSDDVILLKSKACYMAIQCRITYYEILFIDNGQNNLSFVFLYSTLSSTSLLCDHTVQNKIIYIK